MESRMQNIHPDHNSQAANGADHANFTKKSEIATQCPVCGGDCAGANPPVTFCPMRDKTTDPRVAPACPNCAWAFHEARKLRLSTSNRITLIAIAERVDRYTLKGWLSMTTLADDTGLSRRQVHRAVGDLVRMGLVSTTRGKALEYTLIRDATCDSESHPAYDSESHSPGEVDSESHQDAGEVDSESHQDVTPSHTLPLSTPLKKESSLRSDSRAREDEPLVLTPPDPEPKPVRQNRRKRGPHDEVPIALDHKPIVDAWNEAAARVGMSSVREWTRKREAALIEALARYPSTVILKAIRMLADNPFNGGKNDHNWTAHFGYLLRPDVLRMARERPDRSGGSGMFDHQPIYEEPPPAPKPKPVELVPIDDAEWEDIRAATRATGNIPDLAGRDVNLVQRQELFYLLRAREVRA